MTPYGRRYLSDKDFELFNEVRRLVTDLPDLKLVDKKGRHVLLSCHILARSVANIFSLKVVDGVFARIYNHSWILLESGWVLDVYPVAIIGGPILVDLKNFQTDHFYKERNFSSLDLSSEEFLGFVGRIEEALREQMVTKV